MERDRDWILAIAHALGLDSGHFVPIVPEVEPLKRLFAQVLSHERRQTASKIRDIAARIGTAAWPEYVRQRLDELANQLEHWANMTDRQAATGPGLDTTRGW